MFSAITSILRILHIVYVLIRYNILPYTYFFSKKSLKLHSKGKRIVLALQKLGPTFIKLGQSLCSRVDIVGEDVANELLTLCDRLPAFSYSQVQKIIEEDFKMKIDEIFPYFIKEPIAAASIAQVHKAKTVDGLYKAVKVIQPNIEKIFKKDIKLLVWLASIAKKFSSLKRFQLHRIIPVFIETLRLELDLRFEGANTQELRDNMKNDSGFYVPFVDWTKTSKRVLTLEWIEGVPIYEFAKLKDRDAIARNLLFCFCNQVYRDRFFHADMHPGNIIIDLRGNIVTVDCGIMGRLDEITCGYLIEILRGFLRRDYKYVAELHYRAGYVNAKYENFITACRAIGEPIVGQKSNNISIAALLTQMIKITYDFNMQVQPQLLLLQKTVLLVEGLCRNLSPGINVWEVAELWVKNNRHGKNRCFEKIKKSYLLRLVADFPVLMKKIESTLDSLAESRNISIRNYKMQYRISWYIVIIILIFIIAKLYQ